jgi:hypothetical protein
MTTSPFDAQNCLPTLPPVSLGTPPPVACLHCGATQATMRRDRQILDARLGYRAHGACCECETDNACPKCRGENLEYGAYESATDRETGYADFGERYYCRDCGATGHLDDTVAVLATLPQPARRMAPASMPAELSEVA